MRQLGQCGRPILQVVRTQAKRFGVPFVMAVGPQETAGEVRARIRTRLAVPEADFANWQLLVLAQFRKPMVTLSRPQRLSWLSDTRAEGCF